MRLKDKVAIVTGAAAGIGEVSARRFASEGACVVATDRDPDRVARVSSEIRAQGHDCRERVCDVTSSDQCKEVVDWTLDQCERIDVLFNNAGFVHQGTLLEAPEEDWDNALDTNVKSMFWMCKFAIPSMRSRKSGSVINTASVAGFTGVVNRGVYSVSKAAVVGLTKSLAIDLVSDRVRVNCICPATVDTPSLQARIAMAEDPEKAREDFIARQPMGRISRPEEIASLALYLASDESAFMTGQAVVIDGGMKL